MNKRERLEHTIAGEPTDRPAVALWRHFPGDDQRPADLARSTVEFQRAYDWDFVKVSPASGFAVVDYGAQDVWEGNTEGTRTYTRRVIERSLDWTALRTLDPTRGALGRQVECLGLVCDAFGDSVPIIQTVFSPLAQAKNLAGEAALIRQIRTNPDRVHTGLSVLTDSTLRFIDSLRRLPIAGIYYAIQHASYAKLSEEEYRAFGLFYDRKILDSLPTKWWFSMAHLHGELPMFKFVSELRVQALNWHDRDTEPDLANGKLMFAGALCGGISREAHLHLGTPGSVREAVRDAIQQTNGRRLILASGCVAMVTSPLSNIRALREAVEKV
jgi:uroporphyrinogen decarboxylase